MSSPLRVDVWSDVACPWCWVGKRHLEQAVAEFKVEAEAEVEVVWRAFELDPHAPRTAPASVDYVGKLAHKYGTNREQAQGFIDRMVEAGAVDGIEFRFDRIRPGNTFDAHRLLAFAGAQGKQNEVKEALFQAYMTDGKSVTDRQVLLDIAVAAGLDEDEALAALSTDAGADHVRDDERTAARLGVTGVPFFLVGGRYGVGGAQPADVLLDVLKKAAADAKAEQPDAAAPACGPDGCD